MKPTDWNSRPVKRYTVGVITPDMSLGQKVAQVYSRSFELSDLFGLDRLLHARYPDRRKLIMAAFNDRRTVRQLDEAVFATVDHASDTSQASFLRSVIEWEAERSQKFSDTLDELLTPEEKRSLVESLVEQHKFGAFRFPLVADAFELTPGQVHFFAENGRSLADRVFQLHPMDGRAEATRLSEEGFIERLGEMSSRQMRLYLLSVGHLAGDEPVSAIKGFYPEHLSKRIIDLYGKKVLEESSDR